MKGFAKASCYAQAIYIHNKVFVRSVLFCACVLSIHRLAKGLGIFNNVSLDCHLMIKESMEKLISSACKRFER